jgi:hypothetical protein
MCHHRDVSRKSWTEEHDEEESDEKPSFASEERDVDVDLLEADDD